MTTTAEKEEKTLETMYPGIFIPGFGQALELAAVEIEAQEGAAVHERFWNAAANPEGRSSLLLDYSSAIGDHIAHWGAQHNAPVASRLAAAYLARQQECDDNPPPGWHWPVCDDCLMVAHDQGITGCVPQAAFMQEFGAEGPDHLCEMSLGTEDRGRTQCDCGCRQDGPDSGNQ